MHINTELVVARREGKISRRFTDSGKAESVAGK